MEVPFMRAYSLLTIQTCHKRNAPAIGGMAAQIPVKYDETKNRAAYENVRKDKLREVTDGHDGTWVAHPAMVELAMGVFDEHMPKKNQINRKLEELVITEDQLLEVPVGPITKEGLVTNIEIGIRYLSAWLAGRGAVPLNHLMEDAATAEISRAQVWQWINHPEGKLESGEKITFEFVTDLLDEQLKAEHPRATALFLELIRQDELVEFLTIPAYEQLVEGE